VIKVTNSSGHGEPRSPRTPATHLPPSLLLFPPRQKAASFTIDQVVEKLEAAITSHR
jgi:hypothetical protein